MIVVSQLDHVLTGVTQLDVTDDQTVSTLFVGGRQLQSSAAQQLPVIFPPSTTYHFNASTPRPISSFTYHRGPPSRRTATPFCEYLYFAITAAKSHTKTKIQQTNIHTTSSNAKKRKKRKEK